MITQLSNTQNWLAECDHVHSRQGPVVQLIDTELMYAQELTFTHSQLYS